MNASPIILEGQFVRLEPLSLHHVPRLTEIGCEEALWRWFHSPIRNEQDMQSFVRTALNEQNAGTSLPFATIQQESGLPVGSTRFMNMVPEHKRVEIGSTWIAPQWQRTFVNTEAKLLMMRHAFEIWNCNRVELKTNSRNRQSREAIARIGGVEEGTLRRHMVNADGSLRDTVYFSILREEWPEVERSLEEKLRELKGRV